ncbi:hypothetical protein IWZ01DRAFT_551645 [Phyllosticta capitalensis]
MVRTRYYAALNEIRVRRAELRRKESSESLASAIEVELELTMVLPTTTKITTNVPTRPTQQVARSPNYSTIIATEMELTLRSPQAFMVPALQQTPQPGSLLYSAPLHANGVPMYPLIPLPGQLVLEAEAGANIALEANDADGFPGDNNVMPQKYEQSLGQNRFGMLSGATLVQSDVDPTVSPIPRPPGPDVFSRRTSKTFEDMLLDQDVGKGYSHPHSSRSSKMDLKGKLRNARQKNSKSSRLGAKYRKYLCRMC